MTDWNIVLIVVMALSAIFGGVVSIVIGYDLITGRYKRLIRTDTTPADDDASEDARDE